MSQFFESRTEYLTCGEWHLSGTTLRRFVVFCTPLIIFDSIWQDREGVHLAKPARSGSRPPKRCKILHESNTAERARQAPVASPPARTGSSGDVGCDEALLER